MYHSSLFGGRAEDCEGLENSEGKENLGGLASFKQLSRNFGCGRVATNYGEVI